MFMTNRAVLLTNLGSPDSTSVSDVRKYLNQFLMDPYVIQLPWVLRRLIVSLFVLPSRPKASAHAYKSIWWEEGSPLVVLSMRLLEAVKKNTDVPVAMAMRYGSPSIESQLLELAKQDGIEEILLVPLYPHYADSTIKTTEESGRTQHRRRNHYVLFSMRTNGKGRGLHQDRCLWKTTRGRGPSGFVDIHGKGLGAGGGGRREIRSAGPGTGPVFL